MPAADLPRELTPADKEIISQQEDIQALEAEWQAIRQEQVLNQGLARKETSGKLAQLKRKMDSLMKKRGKKFLTQKLKLFQKRAARQHIDNRLSGKVDKQLYSIPEQEHDLPERNHLKVSMFQPLENFQSSPALLDLVSLCSYTRNGAMESASMASRAAQNNPSSRDASPCKFNNSSSHGIPDSAADSLPLMLAMEPLHFSPDIAIEPMSTTPEFLPAAPAASSQPVSSAISAHIVPPMLDIQVTLPAVVDSMVEPVAPEAPLPETPDVRGSRLRSTNGQKCATLKSSLVCTFCIANKVTSACQPFANPSSFKRHIAGHIRTMGLFPCPCPLMGKDQCKFTTESADHLLSHLTLAHNVPLGRKSYVEYGPRRISRSDRDCGLVGGQ
ncbi:hypothetical protein MMC25_001526 [Agyrium rufum]|nr:hypothetical protein [Agyrium rufum]